MLGSSHGYAKHHKSTLGTTTYSGVTKTEPGVELVLRPPCSFPPFMCYVGSTLKSNTHVSMLNIIPLE